MIGTRGHDIGMMSPDELAMEMKKKGFDSVQLVPFKCFEGIDADHDNLSKDFALQVSEAFDREGLKVAMLGSYFNPIHPDASKVERSVQRFKKYLSLAKIFNCNMVGTETGSYNIDMSFHPDNHSEDALNRIIEIVKDVVDEAEKCGVTVGIEGVLDFVVSTPLRMYKLLEAVSSSHLEVIFDPVNLVNADNYKDLKVIIEESFRLYGHKIRLIHAKDFVIEDDQMVFVPLGKGLMDYEHFLKLIHEYNPLIEIIIEGYSGNELTESNEYLRKCMKKIYFKQEA